MAKAILVTDIRHSDRPLLASNDPEVMRVVFGAIKDLLDRWEAEARADLETERLRRLVEEVEDDDPR